jgi:hypothetical protein
MKKPFVILTSIFFLFLLGCSKDCDSLLPNCLREKINDKEIQPNGSIIRYNSSKGHVYEVYSGDFSNVFDENCSIVCSLGGFVGVIDCVNGTDTLVLTNPVVVWEE